MNMRLHSPGGTLRLGLAVLLASALLMPTHPVAASVVAPLLWPPPGSPRTIFGYYHRSYPRFRIVDWQEHEGWNER